MGLEQEKTVTVVDKNLSGRPWRTLRTDFRHECETADAPCWICHQPIDYTIVNTTSAGDKQNPGAWEPDHLYPRATHPHLAMDRANLRASHLGCNRARGKEMVEDDLGPPSRRWTKGST